jgi:putative FmdB family regulatory protein
MPAYDYRCDQCGTAFTRFYKSYAAYDAATPTCTACGSADVTRQITGVNIGKGRANHNYADMNANQMLSVLESGDSKAVGEMMRQVGEGTPTVRARRGLSQRCRRAQPGRQHQTGRARPQRRVAR